MATKELIRERLKANHEPVINPMNYNTDLMLALNWYNTDKNSNPKKWFITKFGKQVDFPHDACSDFEYRSAGTLARIEANGNLLDDVHVAHMAKELSRIRALCNKKAVKVVVEDAKPVAKAAPVDRAAEKVSLFLAEFFAMVDQYTTDWKNPNVAGLLTTMGINPAMGKKIVERVQKNMAELNEVLEGKDKQLNEGWSNFKRTEIKRLLGLYETLVEKIEALAAKPVVKKPRVVKAKPASDLVKRLKFKAEEPDLGLKSMHPTKIIGSREVWLFNVKTRRMMKYVAAKGIALSVSGTTIVNYEPETSVQLTIRKPEQVQALTGGSRVSFNEYFDALKGTRGKNNGRTSADVIILACF